jgi:hypothetical protein
MASAKPRAKTEQRNDRVNPAGWSSAHPNEGDNERWKGSPSTETTGDEGTNEQLTHEHARDENAPGAPAPSHRRITRH